ncbi:hypothetical protein B0T14DRAFT_603369 [Immersiella caudata]|uniref:Uncharacterized protein n=1 Tax=Immersiella caudata TaxID=314043 RepID=A0AA39WQ90_9PEZI|nr:hypothetical protein B0T14DRAFT_603369 [Immersiella caudata]
MTDSKKPTAEGASEARAQEGTQWSPGVFQNMPWMGLLGLLGGAVCMAGAILVLVNSDGKRTDSWPLESTPIKTSVLLAILAASANACLRFAFGQAGTIAWWAMMLKGGGTLNDAHRYWEYQTSLMAAATAGRDINRIAVACLTATMLFAVTPLLQAASFETVETLTTPLTLSVALSGDSAYIGGAGWTGVSVGFPGSNRSRITSLTPEFTTVFRDFNNRTAIPLRTLGGECAVDTMCRAVLVTAGWDVSCATSHEPYSLLVRGSAAVIGFARVEFDGGEPGVINVNTAYKSTPDPTGLLVVRNCRMHAAFVCYPVELSGGEVRLPSRALSTRNDTVRRFYPSENRYPSQFGGIALAADNLYQSNISYDQEDGLRSTGVMGLMYIDEANSSPSSGVTGRVWRDPGPDIMLAIRELTFRSATAASAVDGSKPRQIAERSTQTVAIGVYHWRYGYLAAVLVLNCLCAVALAPLFKGWWTLGGRPYSLSPIETARAFGSPILTAPEAIGSDSNAPVSAVLASFGGKHVRYGVLAANGEQGKLTIAETENVQSPVAGERY